MAAKVSIQDIIDAGFRAEQFGTPVDWATADTGYLARLIGRASLWAQGRMGAEAYSAVSAATPLFERVRAAELCWVSAQLWKRRAGFIDSNAVSAMENLAYLDRREFEAQATRAFECAEENIALAAGGETAFAGTGAALVGVETGPFAGRHPC